MIEGDFTLLLEDHPQLFVYERSYEGQTWLVVANFTEEPCEIALADSAGSNADESVASKVIISSTGKESYDLRDLKLAPYEAFVVEK